jgi:MFS family permease
VGGLVFGILGDTQGRKKAVLLSIYCMSGASFLVGCLPTFAQAGAGASSLNTPHITPY